MQPEVFDSQLQFPGTLCLYGASQAGKSTFVLNLLKNKSMVFGNQPIEHIFYVYSSYQEKFGDFAKSDPSAITFLPNYKDIPKEIRNSIVVYDDHQITFQSDSTARLHITDVFQRIAHHQNLFCVCILQTIHNNKLRSLALNSTYQVYFPSIRDNLQISYLNREYFPQHKNFLVEVVRDILKQPHGFLVIDCSRNSHEKFRVRNFVIPHINSKIYLPIDNEPNKLKQQVSK
jgi:hypothetical protein